MMRTASEAGGRKTDDLSVLEELRAVVLRALGGSTATVYLFGSWAGGRRHRASDIDLAIDASPAISAAALAELRDAVEESRVPYRVEIVSLAETDPFFAERVRRTGRVWIERASA